jgi:hypothetical protein
MVLGMPTMPDTLKLDDQWNVREVTLKGEAAEAAFAPFVRHTRKADVVIVHYDDGGARAVMLPWPFWLRVLATVAAANDYPIGKTAGAS